MSRLSQCPVEAELKLVSDDSRAPVLKKKDKSVRKSMMTPCFLQHKLQKRWPHLMRKVMNIINSVKRKIERERKRKVDLLK